MARDEAARERDPLLDRRAYLRLAGTAAGAVAVVDAIGSAAAGAHAETPADGERADDGRERDGDARASDAVGPSR